MAEASFTQIRDLITSMTTEDWQSVAWSRMGGLKFLHSLPLDFVFLKAAARFWDPRDHVFRFQGQELCPLPEEFAAIMNSSYPSEHQLALPCFPSRFPQVMREVCHLSASEVALMRGFSRQVPIPYLLMVADNRARGSLSWGRLVILVLLSQFLLVNTGGTLDCAFLGVLEDMTMGRNPFPAILAETLGGLDRVSACPSGRFSGSPLLLQIWLREKLCLLVPPSVAFDKYKPKHYRSRPLSRVADSYDGWIEYLRRLSDSSIIWTCPWWGLPYVTLETYACCIPIAGVHESSFYAPARLCRQYGQKQYMVSRLPTFQGGPVTERFLEHLRTMWSRRRIQFGIPETRDTTTDDTYKAWVEQHNRFSPGDPDCRGSSSSASSSFSGKRARR